MGHCEDSYPQGAPVTDATIEGNAQIIAARAFGRPGFPRWPRFYRITASVRYVIGGTDPATRWEGTRHLPDFLLDVAQFGIVSEWHAQRIALDILSGNRLFHERTTEYDVLSFNIIATPED